MKKLVQTLIFFIIFAVQLTAQKNYSCNYMVVNDDINNEARLINTNMSVSITDTIVLIKSPDIELRIKYPFWIDEDQFKGVTRTEQYILTWYYYHDRLSLKIIDANQTWTMYLKQE